MLKKLVVSLNNHKMKGGDKEKKNEMKITEPKELFSVQFTSFKLIESSCKSLSL
jgi:hypothetical protein